MSNLLRAGEGILDSSDAHGPQFDRTPKELLTACKILLIKMH